MGLGAEERVDGVEEEVVGISGEDAQSQDNVETVEWKDWVGEGERECSRVGGSEYAFIISVSIEGVRANAVGESSGSYC